MGCCSGSPRECGSPESRLRQTCPRPAIARGGSGGSPSAPRRAASSSPYRHLPASRTVLPALHASPAATSSPCPGSHLPLLGRRVRDDAVVEAHTDSALVRQPDAECPLHRKQRAADPRLRPRARARGGECCASARCCRPTPPWPSAGTRSCRGRSVVRPNPQRSPSVCRATLNARAWPSVLSAGANSWIVSSVLMTFLNTVQSALPNGMDTRPALPVALHVEHHVREEHAHLAVVDLAHHRVVAEVHRLVSWTRARGGAMSRRNWSRQRDLMALVFYLCPPFPGRTGTTATPRIQLLAGEIGRTESAVCFKIANLKACDPNRTGLGFTNTA